jgi:hypothetical protein
VEERAVVPVDGLGATPYDDARVTAMYDALRTQGDLYLIEARTTSGWEPVGDVTLAPDNLASQTLFEGLGFVPRADAPPAYVLRLSPWVVRRRG